MKKKRNAAALFLAAACLPGIGGGEAFADERTFTLDADFDQGTLINLNHDSPAHDQLQLYDGDTKPFRFINVAASGRGTVVRIDTDTGNVVGEYKTAPTPEGNQVNPSRTTVDKYGNVWTANRGYPGIAEGNSAVKIGIVVDGTRCDRNPETRNGCKKNADGSIIENKNGEYVYLDPTKRNYNTCIDRDGDGLIRTSNGLLDILPWQDNGDGSGGAGGGDARVQDAEDECILVYQRLPDAPVPRHVSVDRENNVWVGGYPNQPASFYKLDGETGAILDSFDARVPGCGGYGGTIINNDFDQILGHDFLWSASLYENALLRYDPASRTSMCIPVTNSYGIGISYDGFIWNNMMLIPGTVTKIHPDGYQEAGFPVSTHGEHGRGLAVTPKDNNVWSANSYEIAYAKSGANGTVSRLDANGNLLAVIPVGKFPTGVAVDKAGKVWVTNRYSDNVMRINPATNQVDMTVPLGANARPYNYSDMTGIIRLSHPPIGFWDVVYEGGCNTLWDRISWNKGQESESENAATNSAIKVEVRVAADKAGLAGVPFQTVSNGENLTGMKGQFMEVRATLTTEAPVGQRNLPILYDLTLQHHPLDMTVNIPDQKYSFGFPPFDLDDFITFNPAGDWFNDVVWSYSPLPLPAGWSVNIDANHVVTVTGPPNETNGPPSETRDMPITFSPRLAWSSEQCAAEGDEARFIPNHPPAPCANLTPPCLRQNNKKWENVPLTGFVCDPDGDPVTVRITSITSDEPTAEKPNDKNSPDAKGIGTDTAVLRRERDAQGDGRVYVINFVASDGRGGETQMSLPVGVPHDQSGGGCNAKDSGQKYDATQFSMADKKGKKK